MRALILGAGRMGVRHARVARSLGFETYTVDPNRDADFVSLRQAPPADVVAVATPIADLAAAARTAMLVGCERLLVEKPMARTMAQAQSLVDCARETGTHLLVGYTERFHPLVELLRRDMTKLVGRVKRMHFERRAPLPAWDSPGPSIDLAVHDIDLLHFFGFSPSLVDVFCTNGAVEAYLECSGAQASLDARYLPGKKVRRFLLEGTTGTVECDLVGRTVLRTDPGGLAAIALETTGSEDPLLKEWLALLSGTGPGGGEGLAALSLAMQLTEARPTARSLSG